MPEITSKGHIADAYFKLVLSGEKPLPVSLPVVNERGEVVGQAKDFRLVGNTVTAEVKLNDSNFTP